jgi:aspartyl-tRNA(Asn)/glutamyl-tRNA(Gln) amidotransferase subunit B
MELRTVIGLEIHVQLKTKSKMFCGCDNNAEGKEPNTVVCPVCMGMPGTLPVANKQAIDWTLRTGLALHSEIAKKSKFDRKHYFYPDLPKGYQISQYDMPFCLGGKIELRDEKGEMRKIRIRRIHLEEDAGKLIHPAGADYSLVDLNRAGTPLMEVVTEPDINSPLEAKLFLQKLRTILRHLDVSDADMEKGHLRCDANISVAKIQNPNDKFQMGTPVEIKNMNSFKAVEKALAYEEKRQRSIINEGGKIEKETRGWSEAKGETVLMRGKEYAHDYRYFPEPDLPPFIFTDQYIENIKKDLSEDLETVSEKYHRIGIGQADINVLTSNFTKKRYYDELIKKLENNQEKILAAKWLVNRFFDREYPIDEYTAFIKKLSKGAIPRSRALEVIKKSSDAKKSIEKVIQDFGLTKTIEKDMINSIIDEVINENKTAVGDFKSGKAQALKFLIGKVMAKSKGQADPKTVEDILKNKLK